MCHILSGHKESTSLFEAAEGVRQKRGVAEKVAEKVAVEGVRQKRWLQQRSLGREIRKNGGVFRGGKERGQHGERNGRVFLRVLRERDGGLN